MIMAMLFRSVSSAFRLGRGCLRLPSSLIRGRSISRWELITVDVFATLLHRLGDHDTAWRDGAVHAVEVARSRGLFVQREPFALRRGIERRLSRELLMKGKDPEFSNQDTYEHMLRELGAGDSAKAEAEELAAWELQREIVHTRPVKSMAASVRLWADTNKRVVAVSDTRYTARELAVLLSRHDILGLSAIYASADYAASKFSGRLFDVVTKSEIVDPQQILHVGDDLYADALSAAERGFAVRWV
jgi:FMN phosphatase YigB (HAD superfamily)